MVDITLGIFSGLTFGFIIQRAGATNPDKIISGHLMKDPAIMQFMILAVAFGAVGLAGLQAVGVGRTMILPLSLVATTLGGILFGLGWGLTGYCPGTTWTAVGEGRMDAVFALLGGFAGTLVFGHLHETLIPLLYLPTNMGQINFGAWFGSSPVFVFVYALILGFAAWLVGRLWSGEEIED